MKQIPKPLKPEGASTRDTDVEAKSARVVAQRGPFVDQATTAPLLREFYQRHAPERGEEHVQNVVRTGIPVAELNEKLRDKYGCDLTNFRDAPQRYLESAAE